ncbi:J domain-containing protein [Candidatus Babeliales bacterium]|nr:J domain-containing protein [Candidatus Babeliales bacterium]
MFFTKKLWLIIVLVGSFVVGDVHAAGGTRQKVAPLTPARQAQVAALLLRVPFALAAHYNIQNNPVAANKSKIVASVLALVNGALDLYSNRNNEPCLYTYPWAVYDIFTVAESINFLMGGNDNDKQKELEAVLESDISAVIDTEDTMNIHKVAYLTTIAETFFVLATVVGFEHGNKEDRLQSELFRGLASLSRCGTEFFAADKNSIKPVLFALAAMVNTYCLGGDFAKIAQDINRSHWYNIKTGRVVNVRRESLETLGLQEGATDDQIKDAYDNLARQWNPKGNNAPDAAARFNTINAAYEWLTEK